MCPSVINPGAKAIAFQIMWLSNVGVFINRWSVGEVGVLLVVSIGDGLFLLCSPLV